MPSINSRAISQILRLAKLCLLNGLTTLIPLTAHAAPQLPLEHFTSQGDYLDLKLSPDANHLVARLRHNDRVAAVVIRRADSKVVGGVQSAAGDLILTIDWATNRRLLYTVAEKQVWNINDRPASTGELYAINIDGTGHEIIFGLRDTAKTRTLRGASPNFEKSSHEILSTLDNDPRNILILERPWEKVGHYYMERGKKKPIVSKLNIHNGYRERLETLPHPGAYALADKQGAVHFMAWRSAEDKLHAAYRKNVSDPWRELTYQDLGLIDIWPVSIDHNNETAYLSAETASDGIRRIFALHLTSGDLAPWFLNHDTDIERVNDDPMTGRPVIATTWPDQPKYVYADAPSAISVSHRQLVRAFPKQHVRIADSTDDGSLLLVHVSSATNPGEYYLFDTSSKKADFLFANASWIDPNELQPVTPIALPARDGFKLHGYLTRAIPDARSERDPATRAPMIVLPHGGPHGVRDYNRFNREVQLLANRGYTVLQLNFRGSGGYGSAVEKAGYRQWGGKMIEDLIDATHWTIKTNVADADRICAYGASYGGYAALMMAAKAPDLYRCAIGYAGMYDLQIMHDSGDIPGFNSGPAFLKRVLGNDPAELQAFSPTQLANNIKAPVMLIHGTQDRRAPIVHAKAMRKALRKAGKQPEWLIFNTAGHGVGSDGNRKKLYKRLLAFLGEHLQNP